MPGPGPRLDPPRGPMLDDAAKMIACADALRRLADRMALRRDAALRAGELDVDRFRNNVARESFLRLQVSEIVLKSITTTLVGLGGAQADLLAAIGEADALLAGTARLRRALDVFGVAIGLAEAIALGHAAEIVAALAALRSAVRGG